MGSPAKGRSTRMRLKRLVKPISFPRPESLSGIPSRPIQHQDSPSPFNTFGSHPERPSLKRLGDLNGFVQYV